MVKPAPPVKLAISVEYLTPEMAREILATNTHNRRLSDRLVNVYADAMKNGEWRLNGEPIIIDAQNVLQSGQHRLRAIVASDVDIWTVVVRGTQPEALYSLDAGRRRSLADVLYLRGESSSAALATAVSWYWRWVVGAMVSTRVTATNTHLLDVLDKNPDLRDSMVWGRRMHTSLKLSSGLFTALHFALAKIDAADADVFFTQILSGAGLGEMDPAFVFRRWVINQRVGTSRLSSEVLAAVFVKTWNAYRQHKSLKTVSFRGFESFPEAL